jgi:hypothetical protein
MSGVRDPLQFLSADILNGIYCFGHFISEVLLNDLDRVFLSFREAK